MSVADDVSPGEVYRRLIDHERRTDSVHSSLDNRITNVARDMVPLALYQQAERDRDREVQGIADRVEKLEERPAMTFGRWLGVATIVIAVLALAVQAYGTMKGAK